MQNNERSSFEQSPLVSIALPVLNGGGDLRLAVLSILNQSFKDWELLLIDDGSTDGAIEGIANLFDKRVVLIQDGATLGLSVRLNQAIKIAKGKYFARMDHDDLSHPERIAQQFDFLEHNPNVDLLATRCVTIDSLTTLIGTLPSAIGHSDIVSRPWRGFYMPHPSWMGRTSWFRKHYYQVPAPYCCEDQELLLRAHRTSCYHVLPEYLLAYRLRNHTSWNKFSKTHVAMLKIQIRYFRSRQEWIGAFLCIVVTGLRIARDAWRMWRYRTNALQAFNSPLPPDAVVADWNKRINLLNG